MYKSLNIYYQSSFEQYCLDAFFVILSLSSPSSITMRACPSFSAYRSFDSPGNINLRRMTMFVKKQLQNIINSRAA